MTFVNFNEKITQNKMHYKIMVYCISLGTKKSLGKLQQRTPTLKDKSQSHFYFEENIAFELQNTWNLFSCVTFITPSSKLHLHIRY